MSRECAQNISPLTPAQTKTTSSVGTTGDPLQHTMMLLHMVVTVLDLACKLVEQFELSFSTRAHNRVLCVCIRMPFGQKTQRPLAAVRRLPRRTCKYSSRNMAKHWPPIICTCHKSTFAYRVYIFDKRHRRRKKNATTKKQHVYATK